MLIAPSLDSPLRNSNGVDMFSTKLSATHLSTIRALDALVPEVSKLLGSKVSLPINLTYRLIRTRSYFASTMPRRESNITVVGDVIIQSQLAHFEALLEFDKASADPEWEMLSARIDILPHSFEFGLLTRVGGKKEITGRRVYIGSD